ncbi:MAG: STT3 domain-containing protein, partial [Candidatus Aenigmarchaeota archaeon]|nr:STT3 domain-containing protein [Candidatus Aenigmarchaeota archaeon]
LQSFYPPGRPVEPFQGWPYTIILFYKFLQFFKQTTLTEAAILSPLLMVALIPIPAFFLGKTLTENNIAGLATALFAVLTPTFIGVSTAGYCDSDATVVFYSFLSVFSVMLALKKRSIPYYASAILANLLFVFNWGGGWLTLILFFVFFPAIIFFRAIESVFRTRKFAFDLQALLKEAKTFLLPLGIIFIVTNLIGFFLWNSTMLHSFFGGLAFTGLVGQPLLVNISVAELQPINIFSREGFFAVVNRVGLLPVLLTFFGLPLLAFYKIYRKERISFEEIFLFLWAFVMFYLITRGVRFSLLFSIASAVSAGYVIGNLLRYLKGKNVLIFSTVFGFIALLTLMFVSDAIQFGLASTGMILSQNWYDALDWLKVNADKDSLIVTWWDPGHIIAGYTGLKVHADGAHCPPGVCIPYDHNIRIQDMGFVFSTSDEEKAVATLKKYMSLTPQQCQEVKKAFADAIPKEACKPVTEMYLIASSDLIGKYHWLSYFGQRGNAKDFIQLPLTGYDPNQGILSYYNGVIYLIRKENQWVPVYQGRYVIKEIVYYEDGAQKRLNFTNVTDSVDGLLWVDPSYRIVIFMLPEVRDSLFTIMFFWNGRGLKHFDLKFSNPEVRIFKVIF